MLAFFSGGYFDGPRVWAGLIAWVLVAVAALAARRPIPSSGPARLALGGLALLAVWTLISFTWSPVAGTAYHDGQRVFLYLGVMLAASALLGGRAVRLVEPAIGATALVVVGYGLSERLVPWLLSFQHSISAQGRLEQPLTYWNAMGAVAAIGLVLAARLAGDRNRPERMRIVAAVAAAPLGLGLYMSFSRGALFACAAGLLALLVLDANFATLRGIALALGAGVLATLCAAPFSGVTLLSGSHHHRVLQGTVVLVLLAAIMIAAALTQRALCRREREQRLSTDALPLPRRAGITATVLVIAGFGLFLLVGAKEKSTAPLASGATRLTSLQSNRYAYWRVAWRAFKVEPLHGVGGGGWATYWLRYRPIDAGAKRCPLAIHPDAGGARSGRSRAAGRDVRRGRARGQAGVAVRSASRQRPDRRARGVGMPRGGRLGLGDAGGDAAGGAARGDAAGAQRARSAARSTAERSPQRRDQQPDRGDADPVRSHVLRRVAVVVAAGGVARVYDVEQRHDDREQRAGEQRQRPGADPAPEDDRDRRHRRRAGAGAEHEAERGAGQQRHRDRALRAPRCVCAVARGERRAAVRSPARSPTAGGGRARRGDDDQQARDPGQARDRGSRPRRACWAPNAKRA